MLRRSSLKRSAMPKRRKPVGVIVADVWRNGMESACAMCGTRGVRLDGHHAVYAQTLKRHGLHAFLMDTRNRVALCRDCHRAHHNRSRPLTREQLPASVFEFAAEVELTWWLEKHYESSTVSTSGGEPDGDKRTADPVVAGEMIPAPAVDLFARTDAA